MDQTLIEALDAVEHVTASPELWVEAPLARGQIQYLNNHELGHYRSSFEDSADPAKKTTLAEGVSAERLMFQSLFATDDQKEGMAAFSEKRSAIWKNK